MPTGTAPFAVNSSRGVGDWRGGVPTAHKLTARTPSLQSDTRWVNGEDRTYYKRNSYKYSYKHAINSTNLHKYGFPS